MSSPKRFSARDVIFIILGGAIILWWLPPILSDRGGSTLNDSRPLRERVTEAASPTRSSGLIDPKTTIIAFYRAVEIGDRAAIRSVLTSNGLRKEPELFESVTRLFRSRGGIKSLDVIREEIDARSNRATVIVRLTYGNGSSESFSAALILDRDGLWKLDG